MTTAPATALAAGLSGQQTIWSPGRADSSAAGGGWPYEASSVIALVRNPLKADVLPPPIALITSLDQLPADIRIDAVVNLAGEPIGNGLWTEAKRRAIWIPASV